MVTIQSEPARRQLNVAVTDLLDTADVPPFIDEYRKILAAPCWVSNDYAILIDATRATVQPRHVAEAFEQLVQNSPKKARRIALVLSRQLLALQAKRVFQDRDETSVFSVVEEAQAWLDRP